MQLKVCRKGLFHRVKMAKTKEGLYKCFYCGKSISYDDVKKRIRCVYCGSKILYKTRHVGTIVKAE